MTSLLEYGGELVQKPRQLPTLNSKGNISRGATTIVSEGFAQDLKQGQEHNRQKAALDLRLNKAQANQGQLQRAVLPLPPTFKSAGLFLPSPDKKPRVSDILKDGVQIDAAAENEKIRQQQALTLKLGIKRSEKPESNV